VSGSVCANVSADEGEGADETNGAQACPEAVDDALRMGWSNGHTFRNRSRSCVHFMARNLLDEEIQVEYEASANMVGSDVSRELPMPPHEKIRTYAPGDSEVTELNLQIAYDFNVLEDGEWVEVHVRGRLLSPVETPMMELPTVEVISRLDEYGRIDDIDYRNE